LTSSRQDADGRGIELGNRNLIEKGIDEDGRKYYKIFFESEE
jgi:hypothetical protein